MKKNFKEMRDYKFLCENSPCTKEAKINKGWNTLFAGARAVQTARKFCSKDCKAEWMKQNKIEAKKRVKAFLEKKALLEGKN